MNKITVILMLLGAECIACILALMNFYPMTMLAAAVVIALLLAMVFVKGQP